jgi:hypothetical protein
VQQRSCLHPIVKIEVQQLENLRSKTRLVISVYVHTYMF